VNSSKRGDLVLDLFGGSGSTLIACERKGRKARLMEIDARYVDCIIERWEQYTGQDAVLEGDGRSFAEMGSERHKKAA
jgi:DNA modification methylase